MHVCTVHREFFGGKIFRRLNFHLVLFSSLWPLDNMNLLHLYVEEMFRQISFSRWSAQIFCYENFPIFCIYCTYCIYVCIVCMYIYCMCVHVLPVSGSWVHHCNVASCFLKVYTATGKILSGKVTVTFYAWTLCLAPLEVSWSCGSKICSAANRKCVASVAYCKTNNIHIGSHFSLSNSSPTVQITFGQEVPVVFFFFVLERLLDTWFKAHIDNDSLLKYAGTKWQNNDILPHVSNVTTAIPPRATI